METMLGRTGAESRRRIIQPASHSAATHRGTFQEEIELYIRSEDEIRTSIVYMAGSTRAFTSVNLVDDKTKSQNLMIVHILNCFRLFPNPNENFYSSSLLLTQVSHFA